MKEEAVHVVTCIFLFRSWAQRAGGCGAVRESTPWSRAATPRMDITGAPNNGGKWKRQQKAIKVLLKSKYQRQSREKKKKTGEEKKKRADTGSSWKVLAHFPKKNTEKTTIVEVVWAQCPAPTRTPDRQKEKTPHICQTAPLALQTAVRRVTHLLLASC